jgi:hypothetical protein
MFGTTHKFAIPIHQAARQHSSSRPSDHSTDLLATAVLVPSNGSRAIFAVPTEYDQRSFDNATPDKEETAEEWAERCSELIEYGSIENIDGDEATSGDEQAESLYQADEFSSIKDGDGSRGTTKHATTSGCSGGGGGGGGESYKLMQHTGGDDHESLFPEDDSAYELMHNCDRFDGFGEDLAEYELQTAGGESAL